MICGYNSNAAQQFIQLHETKTVPAEGAVPRFSFPVGGSQFYSFVFGQVGADFDALTVCNSTTSATKTIGANDTSFQGILAG